MELPNFFVDHMSAIFRGIWAGGHHSSCVSMATHERSFGVIAGISILLVSVSIKVSPIIYTAWTYSGPSILRPPMGPGKCGLILQVVLK